MNNRKSPGVIGLAYYYRRVYCCKET